MDREAFAALLRSAILGAWDEIVVRRPADCPYAFSLIADQDGSYLGYAAATKSGLRQVAAKYDNDGYRYQAWEWEQFDNCEKLSIWLRWANPDDGWEYGDFPERFRIPEALCQLAEAEVFGPDCDGMEEYCTDVVASLQLEADWRPWSDRVVLGFSYGKDPRDFLRTATRANNYPLVRKLWVEHWRGEELDPRIRRPEK